MLCVGEVQNITGRHARAFINCNNSVSYSYSTVTVLCSSIQYSVHCMYMYSQNILYNVFQNAQLQYTVKVTVYSYLFLPLLCT